MRTTRDGNGTGLGQITLTELLKLQKSGQFPDEPVRIKPSPRKKNSAHVRLEYFVCLFSFLFLKIRWEADMIGSGRMYNPR